MGNPNPNFKIDNVISPEKLVEIQRATNADADGKEERDRNLRANKLKPASDTLESIVDLRDPVEPVQTGIAGLDAILHGGLRAGVTVIGAVSNIGKTTMAVQVADHVAAHGKPVLFVTMEQSDAELTARSLNRFMRAAGTADVPQHMDLLSRTARAAWTDQQRAAFGAAADEYARTVAPRCLFMEAGTDPTAEAVCAAAERIKRAYGEAPVVFIDYIQLLSAEDSRTTDKQRTDNTMRTLQRYAKDAGVAVFAISSLNRTAYYDVIKLDSYKESGMIEYGADVLLGLQPRGMRDAIGGGTLKEQDRKAAAARMYDRVGAETVKELELTVVKVRNGAKPDKAVPVTFDANAGAFLEPTGTRAALSVEFNGGY